MRIKPFHALRPPTEVAHLIAAPPYDTVDTEEARALSRENMKSFIRVTRPEVDLPPGTDPHSGPVYERAAANLAAFKEEGLFVREAMPCVYVYRQTVGDYRQTGVVVCCHVADYREKVIVQHEKTRADKQMDRTRHIEALNANAGPVFLTYSDNADIDRLVDEIEQGMPLYDMMARDGVQHTVWRAPGTHTLVRSMADVPRAYVADGHHRAAAAADVAAARAEQNPGQTGDEEYNWFLAVLFPASHLRIFPYNRVVHDLNGLSAEALLQSVKERFRVTEGATPDPPSPGRASMYLEGKWYGLAWDVPEGADPVAALDVSVLQDRLLKPLLGIADPRTDERITFVGGIRGPAELEARVDSGRGQVAFSLHAVSVEQVMRVSDSGAIMPPKSTWFEPKLLSGLIVHELD